MDLQAVRSTRAQAVIIAHARIAYASKIHSAVTFNGTLFVSEFVPMTAMAVILNAVMVNAKSPRIATLARPIVGRALKFAATENASARKTATVARQIAVNAMRFAEMAPVNRAKIAPFARRIAASVTRVVLCPMRADVMVAVAKRVSATRTHSAAMEPGMPFV